MVGEEIIYYLLYSTPRHTTSIPPRHTPANATNSNLTDIPRYVYDDTDNEVDVVNSKRKKREVNVDNAYNELIEDCTQHND